MKRILITNDDGFKARVFEALVRAFQRVRRSDTGLPLKMRKSCSSRPLAPLAE